MARTLARLVPVVVATVVAVGVAIGTATLSGAPDAPDAPASPAPPIASLAELSALERTAEAACRCERDGGEHGACWSAYDKRTAGLEPVQAASACAPVSVELDCFMVNGKESCIVTGRNGTQLCNEAEAQAYEAAFNRAMKQSLRAHPGDMSRASKAANDAGDRAMASIRKGIVPPADPSSQGCS